MKMKCTLHIVLQCYLTYDSTKYFKYRHQHSNVKIYYCFVFSHWGADVCNAIKIIYFVSKVKF